MCKVENCNSKVFATDLCSKHYNRLRTTGTTDDGPRARKCWRDRFWKYVEKTDCCWNWTGAKFSTGYGSLGLGGRNGSKIGAHRASWIIHYGELPCIDEHHGAVVMHKCDNRQCVNPDHLQLGTQRDNVLDMIAKGRRVSKQPKGSKHGNSKFTDDQVRQIRASELNNAELGRLHGVTRQTIQYIRTKGWKSVI